MPKEQNTNEEPDIQTGPPLRLKKSGEESTNDMYANISKSVSREDLLQEFKVILEQNQELLARVYKTSEKVRKYLFWIHAMNVLKFVVLVIPLALSIIYLPPLLKSIFPTLGEDLGVSKEDLTPKGVIQGYKDILGN